MHKNLTLPNKPQRIIVIMMRYLGDVLLTTPLISTLHKAYPSADIDVLVFKNTAGMLEGNPHIHQIITLPNKPNLRQTLNLYKSLFQKYDLSVNTQIGDRPFIISLLAAPKRISAVPEKKTKGAWKRYFANGWTEFDDKNTHTVLQHLKLAGILNLKPEYLTIPPAAKPDKKTIHSGNYVIIHAHPKWQYKRWPIKNWAETCNHLIHKGHQVVLTGSQDKQEIAYIKNIENLIPTKVINLAGKLSLAELSQVISQAKLFIGPDTGITHLAAATGIPVIALFGPTNPVKWSPWPYQYRDNTNPFIKTGNQHVNNIYLIQGQGSCVPCHQEGCEKNRLSYSKCLDNLNFSEIKDIINISLSVKSKN